MIRRRQEQDEPLEAGNQVLVACFPATTKKEATHFQRMRMMEWTHKSEKKNE
jgi:hypothetical protein